MPYTTPTNIGAPDVTEQTFFDLIDKYGYTRGYRFTIQLREYAANNNRSIAPGRYFDVELQNVRDTLKDGRWWPYQASKDKRGAFTTYDEALAYGLKNLRAARTRIAKTGRTA